MTDCKFEELIDEYLLNKLSEESKVEFEQHYFNCPSCFQKMAEKDEMITAIKWRGHKIFADLEQAQDIRKAPVWERLSGFLSPKQLVTVAATAALLMVVVFGVIPHLKNQSPQFVLDDHTTRGTSITLISDSVPGQFQWQSVDGAVQYKIEIENHETLWQNTTDKNYIRLPEEIRSKMRPGVNYFWQVKAFSQEGTLIAQSSRIQFSIPD